MGSLWSKYGECGATTGLMLLSLVLAILGIALIYTIIGIFVGMALIITSWILFLISLIMLIKVVATKKWKDHTLFCKVNVFICILLLILLIAFSATGGVEHQKQNTPANPAPDNQDTTAPSQPSL
jgi:uncharacterized membrane protein